MNNRANQLILSEIDRFCQEDAAKEGRRTHLGASIIGRKCEREVWYQFRWAATELHSGQQIRLFSRGHFEEPRFVSYLRGIGMQVWETDPEGKQWRIGDVLDHFGGSCDGVGTFPAEMAMEILGMGFDETTPILLEFKTSNAKNFAIMKRQGMKLAKPEHWAQICTYGFKMGIFFVIYIVVNKDTDALHVEFLEIDHEHGRRMVELARGLITNPEPPDPRYPPGHHECKFCNFKLQCHFKKPMEKNCRSCQFSVPIEGGIWGCSRNSQVIPKEIIPVGCELWSQHPNA